MFMSAFICGPNGCGGRSARLICWGGNGMTGGCWASPMAAKVTAPAMPVAARMIDETKRLRISALPDALRFSVAVHVVARPLEPAAFGFRYATIASPRLLVTPG